jgi:hypothetical protein
VAQMHGGVFLLFFNALMLDHNQKLTSGLLDVEKKIKIKAAVQPWQI